jgi:hypothetical protein
LEWIGLVVGLVGLVPTVILAREYLRERVPLRRVLDLRSKAGVEFLITTSAAGISSVGPADGPRAWRELIPSGDLAGVAELFGLMVRVYPGRDLLITPSMRPQGDRRRDQIVVGGPVHNRYTSQLVCGDMTSASSDTPIVFDADRRYIRLGDTELGPDLDLCFEGDVPQLEYCLVLLSSIQRLGTQQRVIVAAGLTTYGTHAAAHFVAHHLASYCESNGLGRKPNTCILVRSAIANGQPYDLKALHHITVDKLGAWR